MVMQSVRIIAGLGLATIIAVLAGCQRPAPPATPPGVIYSNAPMRSLHAPDPAQGGASGVGSPRSGPASDPPSWKGAGAG